jgi:hypothetical protein
MTLLIQVEGNMAAVIRIKEFRLISCQVILD